MSKITFQPPSYIPCNKSLRYLIIKVSGIILMFEVSAYIPTYSEYNCSRLLNFYFLFLPYFSFLSPFVLPTPYSFLPSLFLSLSFSPRNTEWLYSILKRLNMLKKQHWACITYHKNHVIGNWKCLITYIVSLKYSIKF